MLTRPESTSTPDCVVKRWWGQFIYRWGQLGDMRKALVLMMTTCILFAGCIEGLTETTEDTIKEMAPGWTDRDVQAVTEPLLVIAQDLKEMTL